MLKLRSIAKAALGVLMMVAVALFALSMMILALVFHCVNAAINRIKERQQFIQSYAPSSELHRKIEEETMNYKRFIAWDDKTRKTSTQ